MSLFEFSFMIKLTLTNIVGMCVCVTLEILILRRLILYCVNFNVNFYFILLKIQLIRTQQLISIANLPLFYLSLGQIFQISYTKKTC